MFYGIISLFVFSRERIRTFKNRIYGQLIVTNLIGIIFFIVVQLITYYLAETYLLNIVVTKELLTYYADWIVIFSVYAFFVSLDAEKDTDIRGVRLVIIKKLIDMMGGVEVLKKLKQISNFHIPVIAFIGDTIQGKATRKHKDRGFNGLSKPIEKRNSTSFRTTSSSKR